MTEREKELHKSSVASWENQMELLIEENNITISMNNQLIDNFQKRNKLCQEQNDIVKQQLDEYWQTK